MDTQCSATPRDRADIRRHRIIDAARTLFIENGFHATGVAQIARASGVAVGQIYRDFEAKEDIVAQIVATDCAKIMARESLFAAISEGDAATVRTWIAQFVDPVKQIDTQQLFAEIVAESARNVRIAAIFDETRCEFSSSMLAALALLAPGDHLADQRRLLADLVMMLSLGLKQHHLVRPGEDMQPLIARVLTIIDDEIATMRALPTD